MAFLIMSGRVSGGGVSGLHFGGWVAHGSMRYRREYYRWRWRRRVRVEEDVLLVGRWEEVGGFEKIAIEYLLFARINTRLDARVSGIDEEQNVSQKHKLDHEIFPLSIC